MCSTDPNAPRPAPPPEDIKKMTRTYRVVLDVEIKAESCEVIGVKFVKANNTRTVIDHG